MPVAESLALPLTQPRRATYTTVRIVADDLTGACDSAAAFLIHGHRVRVWLGPNGDGAATEGVQAFNTASRHMTAARAARTVATTVAAFDRTHGPLLFKKVDSAGRGQLAAEVKAFREAAGARAVLFAPAFPAAGRTVRNGILRIEDAGGVTLKPLLPLFDHVLPTEHIRDLASIPEALRRGASCLVCDAETQAELDALAQVDEPGLVFAGSAGLAAGLAARHRALQASPTHPLPQLASVLTVCGTRHPVTLAQLQHLADTLPVHPRLQLLAEDQDRDAILAAFAQHNPEGLILTGGDTALLVLRTLGATSLLLQGELAPGIPWAFIDGGPAHGRVAITKSGGFGSNDALTRILTLLHRSEAP